MAAGVAFGHVADRVGPREVTLALLGAEALSVSLYVFVHSFAAFLVVACFAALAERGNSAVRAALIAAVAPTDRRVAVRAYMRSVTNVGISVGALLAGLAAIITTLCLGAGAPGWIALGALFVAAGAATPTVARVALARRPALVAA